jgi:phage gp36-like protein
MAGPSYATASDLYDLAVPQAALVDLPSGTIDNALAVASRRADSFLGRRFELPLSLWDVDLKEAVCKLAAWQLLTVRGFSPELGDADVFQKNKDEALKWLGMVADGKVTPYGIRDASQAGANNTDDAGQKVEAGYVLQPFSESRSQSSFWDENDTPIAPGGVGPPKSRGW